MNILLWTDIMTHESNKKSTIIKIDRNKKLKKLKPKTNYESLALDTQNPIATNDRFSDLLLNPQHFFEFK